MQVQTNLSFNGRCKEAIELYRQAVDAELDILVDRFGIALMIHAMPG